MKLSCTNGRKEEPITQVNTEGDGSDPGPGRRNAAVLEVQAGHCRACGPETVPGKMNGPRVRRNLTNEKK